MNVRLQTRSSRQSLRAMANRLLLRFSPLVLAGMLLPLGMAGCSDSDEVEACEGQECDNGPGDDSGTPLDDAGADVSDGDSSVDADGGEKPMTASATIGAEGGTIEVLGLALSVPAGALSEDKLLTVTRTSQGAPEGASKGGYTMLYRFDPEGLVFDLPVSVSFSLSPAFLSKPLAVFWSELGDENSFENIGGTKGKDAIVAETSHFSQAFVGEPFDSDGGTDGGPTGDAGPDADSGPEYSAPQPRDLNPQEVIVGSGDLPMIVRFRDAAPPLTPETVFRANGTDIPTFPDSLSTLGTIIPASYFATKGTVVITAFTPGMGESEPLELEVVDTGNSAPTITSVSPNNMARTSGDTIVVSGSGFLNNAKCFFGVTSTSVTFVDSSQVKCSLNASHTQTAGDIDFRIVNPGPGGGASNSWPFTISGSNPTAEITSIEPSTLGQGTSTYRIKLLGSDFLPTMRLHAIRGSEETPIHFIQGATQSSGFGVLPSALLATPGDIVIRATNPTPGGGSGSTATLQVIAGNPTPQITFATGNLKKGESGQTITIKGSGFGAFSSVKAIEAGVTMPNASVTATELVANVPDSVVANTGTFTFRVVNAGPGGGESESQKVRVTAAPKLTSISPSSVQAGSGAFVLTLNGEDLDQGYGAVQIASTRLSPSSTGASWKVNVPADVIASAGALDVILHLEVSGPSNALTLTVTP